jgi:transposase
VDKRLQREYDIELIAPHSCGRRQPTQDGHPLRRYPKRWHIERLFPWLHWFLRLEIRWEYHVKNLLGMVWLGCMKIMLRYL